MIRNSLVTIAVIAAFSALSLPNALAQKTGGTLVQITQPEPPNLAPYISTAGPISQVTAKVFDGLLEYGFDLKPKPSLAGQFQGRKAAVNVIKARFWQCFPVLLVLNM